ncbi:MAG: cell division ATP-binding protein FtsE [Clostridia bacterium]|nr:cell division ATP-binding protein FtsE [Clostridia bacterium]
MIEFKNVSKVYENGTEALSDISLKIEQGEFVFVVGASGAGKSTFLKLVMREENVTSGDIWINDFHLPTLKRKQIPKFRRSMGIVFQDFRLIPKMTVFDNVAFAMRVVGAKESEIRRRVPHALELVALSHKARSYPAELSGGQQQRVALARALVNKPRIIIADEPTGNVDPEMSYEIVDLLDRISQQGTTVVMVTHAHDLVDKFNHRKIVISNGKLVKDTGTGYDIGSNEDELFGFKAEAKIASETAAQRVDKKADKKAGKKAEEKSLEDIEDLDELDALESTKTEIVSKDDDEDAVEDIYPTEGINDEIIENIHENLDDDSKVNDIVDRVLGSKSTLETFVNQDRTDIDYSVFLESVELEETDSEEGEES